MAMAQAGDPVTGGSEGLFQSPEPRPRWPLRARINPESHLLGAEQEEVLVCWAAV